MTNEVKLFTIVGTSVVGGTKLTYRVANGDIAAREKALSRAGHTEISLIALTAPMNKEDAIAFYKTSKGIVDAPAETATTEVTAEVAAETAPAEDAVAASAFEGIVLTAEQKLAAKRARDAARKREARAAAKAA
jgi:hypothetical protein